MKYVKKPVVIDAVQYNGDWRILDAFPFKEVEHIIAIPKHTETNEPGHLEIPTLEGCMRADIGDWIIRGVKGEFYPCKPDIFESTYEKVDN